MCTIECRPRRPGARSALPLLLLQRPPQAAGRAMGVRRGTRCCRAEAAAGGSRSSRAPLAGARTSRWVRFRAHGTHWSEAGSAGVCGTLLHPIHANTWLTHTGAGAITSKLVDMARAKGGGAESARVHAWPGRACARAACIARVQCSCSLARCTHAARTPAPPACLPAQACTPARPASTLALAPLPPPPAGGALDLNEASKKLLVGGRSLDGRKTCVPAQRLPAGRSSHPHHVLVLGPASLAVLSTMGMELWCSFGQDVRDDI